MGGYGALRNGLKYSDTFGAIIALSSALVIEEAGNRTNDVPFFIESRDYAESVFGDLDKLLESGKNPKYLAKQLKTKGKELPKIFMACGDEDSLLKVNQDFTMFLEAEGAPSTSASCPPPFPVNVKSISFSSHSPFISCYNILSDFDSRVFVLMRGRKAV